MNIPVIQKVEGTEPETVKPWLSKTIVTAVIIAAAPFIPAVQAAILANPELAGVIAGAIVAGLRLLNGRKLPLLGESGKTVKIKG